MAEIKLNIPTYGGSGRGYKSGVGSKSKKKPNEWTGYVKGELEGLAGISGAKILAKKAEEDATERTKMKGQIAVGTWGAITKGAVTRGANIAADLDAKRVFQKQIDETFKNMDKFTLAKQKEKADAAAKAKTETRRNRGGEGNTPEARARRDALTERSRDARNRSRGFSGRGTSDPGGQAARGV